MRTRAELARAMLTHSHQVFAGNVAGVSLDEALQSAGGYRSVLGILKHAAAWSHVYHSYAFEPAPRHWTAIDWPRGLRDTIDTSQEYFDELRNWFEASYQAWIDSLSRLNDDALDEQRPCHWGGTAPLFDIVVMAASHWTFHAGELNEILSIVHGEAWEYSEEVEENHISTAGHRVRPDWMSEEEATGYETTIARRDGELHPRAKS